LHFHPDLRQNPSLSRLAVKEVCAVFELSETERTGVQWHKAEGLPSVSVLLKLFDEVEQTELWSSTPNTNRNRTNDCVQQRR